MFQFNFAIYLTILLSIVIGCDNCKKLSDTTFTSSNQGNTKPLIALFHGLGSGSYAFDKLVPELKKAFPSVEVIALTSLENGETYSSSIRNQATICFDDLLKNISILPKRPTLLIGHSQGGLCAYSMYYIYKKRLNVKGIITLATPWEGAPALNSDHRPFLKRLQHPHVMSEMQEFSRARGKDANWLQEDLIECVNKFQFSGCSKGAGDLKPGSEFLNWVQKRLPSAEVPILAIGGEGNDFRVFLPEESDNDFKVLRNLWTKVIVGQTHHNKAHDMIVPLYSQLAENIAPYNSEDCTKDNSVDFTRCTISDAIHDGFLGLPAKKVSKNILHHPEMFEKVKDFGKKVLHPHDSKLQQPQNLAAEAA
ncbi:MAG: alpha/beta hydrolase [Candidatus Cardinium sp.]|mgnify:CR=1 FL=1|uniref:alpha/beta fold hydrolase n=1 Tax=Cardinium endosymbiont of Dermatophagoides farinae TaxID=2597823 RepID=UPI001181D334|nr:alpha/beta hydrolase [Cardinium endosymbiont of Dermatophagoides farinae]TSJ80532.1 alpha/beta hydrolase [Cardinium endosymbiont of Dermatophagoides farinae]UWW96505.1 MAG: alpha/beta hydrolase [Candidatus Cardinium sp.]